MHDPLTVAFEIRSPIPRRTRPIVKGVRWQMPFGRRGGGYAVVAGRWFRFPGLVTVWHREPGGRDSGEVCRMHEHHKGAGWTFYNGWRLHVHHWHIQVHPLQHLRRRLLTRCEWCRGASVKGDPVNVSHQWDRARGPWWRGERGLYHQFCSSVATVHASCLCDRPRLEHEGYGRCAACGRFRAYGKTPTDVDRLLVTVRAGERPAPDTVEQAKAMWAASR